MPWWLSIYLWGLIPGWILSSYAFAHHESKDKRRLDAEDLFTAIMMGVCMCWLWPLFIPGYWLWEWLHGKFGEEKS